MVISLGIFTSRNCTPLAYFLIMHYKVIQPNESKQNEYNIKLTTSNLWKYFHVFSMSSLSFGRLNFIGICAKCQNL
jgi:hypothetical protein